LLENFFNVCQADFLGKEHFRPKSSVRICKGGKLSAGSPTDPPLTVGYYWLAFYVFDPPGPGIDIDAQEQLMLIHPCRDDPPSQHMKFGVAGTVAAVDEKGQRTIEVFGLDRGELADLRVWH